MHLRGVVSSRVGGIVAGAALAALFAGLLFGEPSSAATTPVRSVLVPITPCRLADTRPAPDTVGPRSAALGQGDTYTVAALPPAGPCAIPATAVALELNVTAVDATAATFLTIWPSDAPRPNASSLNPAPGQGAVPNAVTTALSPDGHFNVFNHVGTVNIVIDVVGYYDRFDTAAAAAIQAAAPQLTFAVGTATSIPANGCIFVFAFGVGAPADAGKIVSGYITDSGGVNPPPSINNLTVFLPGTIFKTSQGGTIGSIEVCNPTSDPKALPAGWKLITAVNS